MASIQSRMVVIRVSRVRFSWVFWLSPSDVTNDVTMYNNLRAALTSQILSAVNASFLSALEDPNFGFGDVMPLAAMLIHLRSEYGTLTPEELEKNRAALSAPWNLDDPIEDL